MSDLSGAEKSWIDTAVPVLKGIMERREGGEEYPGDGLRLIDEEFSVPGNPQRYINLLKGLYDVLADPDREWEYSFKPEEDVSPREVIQHLKSKALQTGKGLENDTTKAIYMMVRSSEDTWTWDQLVESISDKLEKLIITSQGKGGPVSDVAIGYFTGLFGTLLILAERGRSDSAQKTLITLAKSRDVFIAIQQARFHSESYAGCILTVLYLNREHNRGNLAFDFFKMPRAFQSATHENAARSGRDNYLEDIQEPEELLDALSYTAELARQAGMDITDEMNHPEHDHGPFICALQEKMTYPDSEETSEAS